MYDIFKSNCKEVSRNNPDHDNENLALELIPNDLFFCKGQYPQTEPMKKVNVSTAAKSTEDMIHSNLQKRRKIYD